MLVQGAEGQRTGCNAGNPITQLLQVFEHPADAQMTSEEHTTGREKNVKGKISKCFRAAYMFDVRS